MTTLDELRARIAALGHAIQTGVAYDLEKEPKSGTPKHLRTGVNMALCGNAALAAILLAKGICTEEEYYTALVVELEKEKTAYEERLSARYGSKITLA
jgi:hypothetical protein